MTTKKPLTIFVVEDDLMYQLLIEKSLEQTGAQIYTFTSCEQALREMHLAPSVVIMDYMLEGDKNGLDAIKEINESNPSVRTILFSIEPALGTWENKSAYGQFDFVEKNMEAFPLLRKMIGSSAAAIAC